MFQLHLNKYPHQIFRNHTNDHRASWSLAILSSAAWFPHVWMWRPFPNFSTLTVHWPQCKPAHEQCIRNLWQLISHLHNDSWLIRGLFAQWLQPCFCTCLREIPPGIKIPRHINILFLFASSITSSVWTTVLSCMPAKRQNTGIDRFYFILMKTKHSPFKLTESEQTLWVARAPRACEMRGGGGASRQCQSVNIIT